MNLFLKIYQHHEEYLKLLINNFYKIYTILYIHNDTFDYHEKSNEKIYHYAQFNEDQGLEIKLKEKYQETSFVKLPKNDLKTYTPSELKIMRNEN